MKERKCKNCIHCFISFCDVKGVSLRDKKILYCSSYEEDETDYDGFDLTDSEIYIRGELAAQDSEAW